MNANNNEKLDTTSDISLAHMAYTCIRETDLEEENNNHALIMAITLIISITIRMEMTRLISIVAALLVTM